MSTVMSTYCEGGLIPEDWYGPVYCCPALEVYPPVPEYRVDVVVLVFSTGRVSLREHPESFLGCVWTYRSLVLPCGH